MEAVAAHVNGGTVVGLWRYYGATIKMAIGLRGEWIMTLLIVARQRSTTCRSARRYAQVLTHCVASFLTPNCSWAAIQLHNTVNQGEKSLCVTKP